MSKTECICPYCKKKFEAEITVRMNPFITDQPIVSEVGINKYYKLKDE